MDRIHRFGLTGFKAFKDTVWLPIQPITVLAGLNSSGKSSLIDALLLLTQTLRTEKRVAENIVLDWSGPFFEVDGFEEMVYDKYLMYGEGDVNDHIFGAEFAVSFERPHFISGVLLNQIYEEEKAVVLIIDFVFQFVYYFQSDQLSELVSIVFVTPPANGEGAKLEPLRVNEEGLIENWAERGQRHWDVQCPPFGHGRYFKVSPDGRLLGQNPPC